MFYEHAAVEHSNQVRVRLVQPVNYSLAYSVFISLTLLLWMYAPLHRIKLLLLLCYVLSESLLLLLLLLQLRLVHATIVYRGVRHLFTMQ
jgi:hypothetical protein